MSNPFTNEYNLRTVATNQSKSCMICYKPSVNVLITENNADFFYICLSHLKDDSFASNITTEEYDQLVKKKEALELLLKELEEKKANSKPSMFNKIPGMSDKEQSTKQQEKYDNIKTEIETNDKELQSLKTEIDNYKFKKYNLNNDVFRIRLRNYINKKVNEKRMKELNEPGFFPSTGGLKDL
ncbi:hypothetical protein CLIB1444_02S11342 [[Candida] jaroonii]|uniref:Uncharacterized protein n=1 Tax=[Candida] jaroonii TaxID=467808 RepID=A0ACA9Y3L5_9ASCO|nr:hypothetical protein CLIB1444_02S11342 [[Candida] jaroonii]